MQKNLLLILICLFAGTTLLAQPPAGAANKGDMYGAKVTTANAISPDQLPALLKDKDSAPVTVQGEVVDVCKAKGCFIYMKTATGKIYIKTKDDKFFVPLAINGKKVAVQGTANKDDKDISIQATGILVL
jgi:uncharacterized protein YdeI (BOF family)